MKVSVLMITYNQENFIAQAIESALMQQVNFEYEIVIGEDCSTDNTRKIVVDYYKKYPNKIRLLLPEKNLGMHKNFIQTWQACQGQYIALLEGDDYWTSSHKLQKQVNFLDNNPECTICFHNATVFYEDQSRQAWEYCSINQEENSRLEYLLFYNFIPTPSVMYKRGIVHDLPEWIYKLSMVDWSWHILHAQHGEIGYINEVMSAYRIHSRGAWSGKSPENQLQETIKMLENIKANLDDKYEKLINYNISCYSEQLSKLEKGNSNKFIKYEVDELLQNIPLRHINLVVFPDWSQPEDLLYQDLAKALKAIVTHPDKNNITLVIDTSNIAEEEANLTLSSVAMNLMMEEDLDVSEAAEIALTGNLSETQWQVLLPRLQARIILNNENQKAITKVGAENIPIFEIK